MHDLQNTEPNLYLKDGDIPDPHIIVKFGPVHESLVLGLIAFAQKDPFNFHVDVFSRAMSQIFV